jgi:hypothetical protein
MARTNLPQSFVMCKYASMSLTCHHHPGLSVVFNITIVFREGIFDDHMNTKHIACMIAASRKLDQNGAFSSTDIAT